MSSKFNLKKDWGVRSLIIAELSANHENDFNIVKNTIRAMAKSGADAVKVQTYTADSLSIDVSNKYYGPKKEGLWKGWRPYDLYKQASMPWEWQPKLKKISEDLGMIFFSTPFDFEAVHFLKNLKLEMYKIASFEINDLPLIEKVASIGKPIIISTGLGDEQDIGKAIRASRKMGNEKIALLKCTSEYPAPIEHANLLTIPDMKKKFDTVVGVSDHSEGSVVPVVSTALGGKIIEKHFTLDKNAGGPDSSFSMEPKEFKEMVENVRKAEASLGMVDYKVSNKDKLRRRSLFAVKDIKKGQLISADDIRSVRPGYGLEPHKVEDVIGSRAKTNIKKGFPINDKSLAKLV